MEKSIYRGYFSEEKTEIAKKDLFLRDGVPNELALRNFLGRSDFKYYLILYEESLPDGFREGLYIFRVKNRYVVPLTEEGRYLVPLKAQRFGLVYNISTELKSLLENENHLKETATHKYVETMWNAEIKLTVLEPTYREVTVYVFPTEYKKDFAFINTIALVDDKIKPRVYLGKQITFGFDGVKFNLFTRFDREERLNVAIFKDYNSTGKVETDITIKQGTVFPNNFGKKISENTEIYPVKNNPFLLSQYIFYNKKTQEVYFEENGIIDIDGTKYAVYKNDKDIDLCLIGE